MKRGPSGTRVIAALSAIEPYTAFLPNDLPPMPPLEIPVSLRHELDGALIELGRLDTITTLLPDSSVFLYAYVRKEAVLSSQIEGTQSSLSDLLSFEASGAPGAPIDDVREVSNYVKAVEFGRTLLATLPLSGRFLREVHTVLLSKGRGDDKRPGEFRTSQNWIGGTRPGNALYVPPPPSNVSECIAALERFLHDVPERTPPLLKAALAHVQFESIHPFLDGNGRLGRLLIALILCAEKVLSEPVLYLSLYLKRHRSTYYELLQKTRTDGAWEEWIAFFARGVRETAAQAVTTARALTEIFRSDRRRIATIKGAAGSALRVHDALQRSAVASIARVVERTGLSSPTVRASLERLAGLGIVQELTGQARHRLYAYTAYLDALDAGT